MAKVTNMDEDKFHEMLEAEKDLLKPNRVYMVLELNEDMGDNVFSMFCLDTTTNREDGEANVCQILGKGLTELISKETEHVMDIGIASIRDENEEIEKSQKVVSLDSYRNNSEEEEKDNVTLTFSFEDKDDGGSNKD
tara:strand:- start:966 stop:1376 length:411 start_codon:yes stop_codon:yes gene_type:complete